MKKLCLPVFLVSCVLASGCAHNAVEQRLDEKVAQEPAVSNRADLSAKATKAIESSKSLSEQQKSQLLSLRDSLHQQTDELFHQSLKLRSILIKDLIEHYDEDEVALIKKRIKQVENKRIALLFDAVEKANKILDRQAGKHQGIMREFFEYQGSRAY